MVDQPRASAAESERRGAPRHEIEDYVTAEIVTAGSAVGLLAAGAPVFLRDVSCNGIGFYAPADLGLAVGQTITLAHGRAESTVRLRWVEPTSEGGWVECGAGFVEAAPHLLAELENVFGGRVQLTRQADLADRFALHFQPEA